MTATATATVIGGGSVGDVARRIESTTGRAVAVFGVAREHGITTSAGPPGATAPRSTEQLGSVLEGAPTRSSAG